MNKKDYHAIHRMNKEDYSLVFESICEHLPCAFSKEDWVSLFERAKEGDPASISMFHALFKREVIPYLKPEIRKKLEKEDI